MRPTVFGKQLVSVGAEFIGLNLGYNFRVEHEQGTQGIVNGLRMCTRVGLMNLIAAVSSKAGREQEKKARDEEITIKRYRSCPYADYMVGKYAAYERREITIDNSPILGKYSTFQTIDGDYVFLAIGDFSLSTRYGLRRKFTEQDFVCMEEYQAASFCYNTGYVLYGHKASNSMIPGMCAAWQGGYPALFVMLPEKYDWVVDGIIKALTQGSLAIVPQEPRLFSDRGCCLVDVEAAYRPRPQGSPR